MTTHAPAVPRRQPRPQAEHVVVAIAATLAFVGLTAAAGSDLRATKDLSAFSAHRWTALPYRYARKGLVGNAIVSCVARVRTIPPPSGED